MRSNGQSKTNIEKMSFALLALLPMMVFAALIIGLFSFPLPWQLDIPWVPTLGINFDFHVDGLSALMMVMISLIGIFVFIYAIGYLSTTNGRWRVLSILPIFMFAMLGAVTADNVIVLFLFWELTSILSFLLVGFNHTSDTARASARQALFVTMIGGVALFAGLLLMADIADSWRLSEIISSIQSNPHNSLLPYAMILIMIGAFTKSAQFPFHFWLPNAMAAPTPISAYLHSATMVKLGIYLLARFDSAFNDWLLWEWILVSAGTITAVWAAILALRETDLKRILARSTLSALGTLTLLIGLPSSGAGLAMATFIFAHALYKAPLFMIAGNIDHATGTRDITQLRGLRHVMPWTATAAIIAGLSMAGLPLAYGFVAKDLISVAKEQSDLIALVSYAMLFVNAIAAAVAAIAAIRLFWGPLNDLHRNIKEVHWSLFLPPMIIAIIGIEFELFPNFFDPILIETAKTMSPAFQATSIETSYQLSDIVAASGLTIIVGAFLYITWDNLHQRLSNIHWLGQYGPEACYSRFLENIKKLATILTRRLQSGDLTQYTLVIIGFSILFIIYLISLTPLNMSLLWNWQGFSIAWLLAFGLILAGAIGAVIATTSIKLIMSIGLIGYGSAILFLFAGAPDLAFTQFAVETIFVIFVIAILLKMPRTLLPESPTLLRIVIPISATILTALMLTHMMGFASNRALTDWFFNNSLPLAAGHNVVNVILVDFRAFDTLGEVFVVCLSVIAVKPLLDRIKPTPSHTAVSPMLVIPAQLIYWVMIIASLVILIRGHNAPGGGFIAGLLAASASSQLALITGNDNAKRWLWTSPTNIAMTGISLSVFSGILGLIFANGFLDHTTIGGIATVLLFDIGVYLAVWGSVVAYLLPLLNQTAKEESV